MADLRIVDAPLLSTVKGTEKIPTGGEGNFSISVNQVADFAKLKWFLATEGYVDNAVGNVQDDLNLHKNNSNNPHGVTKVQVGLGNVDNTADLDKPVSNATQSAIITANSGKADKSYVDSQDQLKADKITTYTKTEVDSEFYGIYQNGAALPYDAAMEYAENAHVVKDGELQKKDGASWVSATNKGYNLDYFVSDKSYPLHAEIMLTNGNIVKSTVANNIIDPNVNMTGWVSIGNTGEADSIADLLAIPNPHNGMRVYVKSYHAGLRKGGGDFIYDSSRVSENDGGNVVNGWVRVITRNYVNVTEFGVKGDGGIVGLPAMQKALDYAYANDMDLELCNNINLTGGTLYIPNINWVEPIKIFGGSIYKADSGFVFSCLAANNERDAPIIENISFLGSGEAGVIPVVFDGDKMLRHQSYNCRYRNFCFVHADSYLQSIRFSENNVVYFSPDSFIKAANAYDFKVLNNSFEASSCPAIEFLGNADIGGSYALSGATINDNLFEGFTKTGCIVFPNCSSVSIDNNYFEGNKHDIHIRTLPEDKNPNYYCHSLSICDNYIAATLSNNSVFVENNRLSYTTAKIEGNFVSTFKTNSPNNVFVNAPFQQSQVNKNFLAASIKMTDAKVFGNIDINPAPLYGISTSALSGGGVRAIVKNLFSKTGAASTMKDLPNTGYLVTVTGQANVNLAAYKFSHIGVLGFGVLYDHAVGGAALVLEHTSLLNIGTSSNADGAGSVATDIDINFAETGLKYKGQNTVFAEDQLFIDMPNVTTITKVDIIPLENIIKTTGYSILPYDPDAEP